MRNFLILKFEYGCNVWVSVFKIEFLSPRLSLVGFICSFGLPHRTKEEGQKKVDLFFGQRRINYFHDSKGSSHFNSVNDVITTYTKFQPQNCAWSL